MASNEFHFSILKTHQCLLCYHYFALISSRSSHGKPSLHRLHIRFWLFCSSWFSLQWSKNFTKTFIEWQMIGVLTIEKQDNSLLRKKFRWNGKMFKWERYLRSEKMKKFLQTCSYSTLKIKKKIHLIWSSSKPLISMESQIWNQEQLLILASFQPRLSINIKAKSCSSLLIKICINGKELFTVGIKSLKDQLIICFSEDARWEIPQKHLEWWFTLESIRRL